MKAEIIAVGSELLTPDRVDTNSLFLTEELNKLGIEVVRKSIVGDNRETLSAAFKEALEHVELIVASGGLGPTEDDLTRETVADLLGRKLHLNNEILRYIEGRFRQLGREMPAVNVRQAMVPEGADVLENPRGSAPGLWMEDAGHFIALLPGPPSELKPMYVEQVLPRLQRRSSNVRMFHRELRVAGLGESGVEQRIRPIYTRYSDVNTTILAAPGEIQIHLRMWTDDGAHAQKTLDEITQGFEIALADRIFSQDGSSMEEVVAGLLTQLSSLVQPLPIGTNLGLFHLLFMLASGRLLESRGAVIPGLAALGLTPPAVRRAWAALAYGNWETVRLVTRWQQQVQAEGLWQPRHFGGYRPVACDLVGFFRPRLQGCPTTHYHPAAGKALPAIPVGIAARIGSIGEQRLAIPCVLLRADPEDASEAALQRRLLTATGQALAEQEALVCDAGFPLLQVLAAGVTRFLVRGAKNFTARRAHLPEYQGKGRPHTYGNVVRPLPRIYKGRAIAATPCDREETWQEDGCVLKACFWENLVVRDGKPGDPTFTCIVIHDPRYPDPLLVLTNLAIHGAVALALYHHRWPIEQVPLVGKQLLGAHRQYLFAPESRQRLPEMALLASSILSYGAATSPAIPTGFWDRAPRATAGRLRRVLSRVSFSELGPLPVRIREKASPTAHLPKGVAAHRRQKRGTPTTQPLPLAA